MQQLSWNEYDTVCAICVTHAYNKVIKVTPNLSNIT